MVNHPVKKKTMSPKIKILLVEDDPNFGSIMKSYLELNDFDVVLKTDGKQGLATFKSMVFDLCILDVMMPEMDGYESIREIRTLPQFRNLPVLAVTAKAMMGDREKCIAVGASDYISKPVDIDQLVSLLRVWLYDKI